MNALTIRDFTYTDEDYAILAALDSAGLPDEALTVAEWRHYDSARRPGLHHYRVFVERDGVAVAVGGYNERPNSQGFFTIHLCVHPAYDADDIRPPFYAHVMQALAPHTPSVLGTGLYENWTRQVVFFEGEGFQVVQREVMSMLDLETFDPAPFASKAAVAEAAGIRIVTLRELHAGPDWQRKLEALFWALIQDVPWPEPLVRRPLEEFIRVHLESPNHTPDGYFIALDTANADRWAGLSCGMLDLTDPTAIRNGLTGVLPEYRRQGIATALKLRLIAWARAQGAEILTTGNEENNPMYQINLRLGFTPKPCWLLLQKHLQQVPEHWQEARQEARQKARKEKR